MRTNTVALSALTLAAVTVALPMVTEVNQDQSNAAASRLSSAPTLPGNLNIPGLNLQGLNLPVSLQTNPLADLQAKLLAAISAVNPLAGLLAQTLTNLPAAILSGTPIDEVIPDALAGLTAGLQLPTGNPLEGLLPTGLLPSGLLPTGLPNVAGTLPSVLAGANPLDGLLSGILTGLPAGLLPSIPAVVPVVVPTPAVPVASAASITPVAIPTTILRQVPALVPSTLTTQIATVVPTNVVQAVPTNILGLLQPIVPGRP